MSRIAARRPDQAGPPREPSVQIAALGLVRLMLSATLFAAALAAPPGPGAGAAAAVLRLRCTNPASGASWPVVVDIDRHRVDSLPATISDRAISWHDPKQGFFDLDRATGALELRNASSTGGYFLHYTCRPE